MSTIKQAVGRGVTNTNRAEVKLVQQLLNRHRLPPLKAISEDGISGLETINAIIDFQRIVVKMANPDGRVDPQSVTFRLLSGNTTTSSASMASLPALTATGGYYSHPDAVKIPLAYGPNAVKLTTTAENLLKSILASCGMTGGMLTSTLRTYHDQARITITQTYKRDPSTVSTWYGAEVLKACKEHLDDIDGFAKWWEAYDKKRGKVSSLHLTNRAMDVVPTGDRAKFAARVKELVDVKGSGVRRIIPKGVMGEPVDHVEFTFDVT